MMRYRLATVLLLLPLLTAPVQAGIIFGRKKDKVDPKQRVPELIVALKADKDADKRMRAAEELREYDPAAFPALIPALIDALNTDAKAGVRIEAAHSLAKLRPVSQLVGEALEQAVSKDESMRVRLQARSALLQYHWAGYRGKKSDAPPPLNTTREPPVATEKGPPPINTIQPVPAPAPAPQQPVVQPVRPTPVPTPPPGKTSRGRIRPVPSDPPVIHTSPPKPSGSTAEPPLAAPPAAPPAAKPGEGDGPALE